ncbi:MAG: polysaccharide biosynthesis tyrosine autokinase [Gemmataceae bacterium]
MSINVLTEQAGVDPQELSPLTTLTKFAWIAWHNKWLVMLGVVVGLILGALSYAQTSPTFQSTAQILVIKKRPDFIMPANGSEMRGSAVVEDYLGTHVVMMQSDEVLSRAAKLVDCAALDSPPLDGDATGLLKAGLVVAREKEASSGGTSVLNVSFRCASPTDSYRLLSAAIDGYKKFLADTYSGMNDETLTLIDKAQKLFNNELLAKQKELQQIVLENPLAIKSKEGVSTLQDRIRHLEEKRSSYALRQTQIETRQKVVDKALKEGKSRTAILTMLLANSTDGKAPPTPNAATEAALLELKLQEKELTQTFGPNHPSVLAIRSRMQLLREQASLVNKPDQPKSVADPLEMLCEGLKLEHEEAQMVLDAIGPRLEAEQKNAQSLAGYLLREEEARNEVNRLRLLCDGIIDRIRQINVTREAGGFDARTLNPPGPGFKVAPSLFNTLALALIGGLALGLGLAYLADFSDRSFRSPAEISQALGLRIVGHIPHLTEPAPSALVAPGELAPHLVAAHKPTSPESEAFRGVRTALYFSTQGRGHQVVQITSPNMGDGKSTLAGNLAVSIAQSGKRTILLDADFRRPRAHKLFPGIVREVGLSSVIAGSATLGEAIQPTAVANLSIMPCGPRPENPAELLTSSMFQDVLNEIRGRYDFVLVDTPPVLLVSDPCAVAPRVEGVLLVIRLAKNNRPPAERAVEILTSVGANILGVMVNDKTSQFGSRSYGGGYGGYGYGYKYGYKYGYNYNYNYGYGYQPTYGEPPEISAIPTGDRGVLPPLPAPGPETNGFHPDMD